MMPRQTENVRALILMLAVAIPGVATAQSTPETFSATAQVKGAGGGAASAPVTIVVERKMPQTETDKYLAAFKSGGAAALRKALAGVPNTGSVRIGSAGAPVPTRLTLERSTGKGRLLTIVTDQPIMFLGAGQPGAKPKEGYDFGIIDLEVDEAGSGVGSIAPAAKVTVKQGVFVVDDYSAEFIKLAGVKKAK